MHYVGVDETGRICVTVSDENYADESYIQFEFPDDFNFSKQGEYRIQNGELIHDPKPKSEEELAAEKEVNRQQQIALAIPLMIQANSASIPDAQAMQIPLLFREWKVGDSYTRNEIIQCDGELYRIGHDHTAQAQWVPGTVGMTALYSHIEIGEDNYEVWKAWDGVSGIYQQGQIVHDPEDDNKLYKSKIPNNVWGPPHSMPAYWDPYTE